MIYITSFRQSIVLPERVERWSAAVYQPKGFNYPKAAVWDIRPTEFGETQWVRPREFVGHDEPLMAYRETLLNLYAARDHAIKQWLNRLQGAAALCCWCPYDKAAQRQLLQWGSFVCHTAVVGEHLTNQGVEVWYDGDRRKMTVLTQLGLPTEAP